MNDGHGAHGLFCANLLRATMLHLKVDLVLPRRRLLRRGAFVVVEALYLVIEGAARV